jgi:hypothetical protein
MAFYIGSNVVIGSDGTLNVGQYANRAALPSSSVTGYISFVADQAELVNNTGSAVATTGTETTVTWYKYLLKPMDYKNEVILQQGTVGGGYVNSSVWNTIGRINTVNDIMTEDVATMSFTTNYGGWHSTALYAYYHQGGGTAANKQSWVTATVSTITSRPASSTSPNSLQPGPIVQNTLGLILSGTSSWYITFSNDTWTTGGYNPPTSQGYGAGSFGQTYGYTYTYGNSVAYLNWSNSTWTTTSSGNHINGAGTYGKILTTKWNKFYYIGDNTNSTQTVSVYSMATNTWSNSGSNEPNPQSEGSQVMAQDWGYMCGGYGPSGAWAGQNAYSLKTMYATDTTFYNSVSNGVRALSSGSGCWGPLP